MATLTLMRLRSHPVRSLVVVAVVAVACGIAISALAVWAAAGDPWPVLRAATNGGDVEIDGSSARPDPAALAALPHVRSVGIPVERGTAGLDTGGEVVRADLMAMTEATPVDRPLVTDGRWFVGDDEVVLETGLAATLGVRVGDRVTLSAGDLRTVRVVGTAVTVMRPNYPERTPGAVFVGRPLYDAVDPIGPPLWSVGVRLDDPAHSAEVAARIGRELLPAGEAGRVRTSDDIRDNAFPSRTRAFAEMVLLFAVLMLISSLLLIAVLLGSRLVSEARQLVLLQVAGVTPGRLAAMVALEHAVLAGVGALAGVPIAVMVAPRIAESTAVLGSVAPRLSGWYLGAVAAVAVGFTAIVAGLGGLRAGRRSLAIVARGGTAPVRRSRAAGLALAATSRAALVLGFKDIATRRGRTVSGVLGVALATVMATAFVGIATAPAAATPAGPAPRQPVDPGAIEALPAFPSGINEAIVDQVAGLVGVMQLLLGGVALVTLIAVAAMSMRERLRELGVLHALGCSTGQLVGASAISQAGIGVVGAALGVPLGLGFYLVLMSAGGGGAQAPPGSTLLAVAAGAVAVSAATGVVPAVLAQRVPSSVALATE